MDLTDEQWEILEPLIPSTKWQPGGPGRPPKSPRQVLDGILWILRTGAQWHDMPNRYPPYQTCHRRFQQWQEDGTFRGILAALAKDLRERGGIDDIEAYIDGSYVGAKKGDPPSESAVPAMRRRSWRLQTALVFLSPLALEMVRDTTSPLSSKLSTKQ